MIEMPKWLQDQWVEEIRVQIRDTAAFAKRVGPPVTSEQIAQWKAEAVSHSIRHESREERQAPTVIWPDRLGRWLKTRYFCIECGQQDVWQEENDGDDYYQGHSVTCFNCKHQQNCVDGIPYEDKR